MKGWKRKMGTIKVKNLKQGREFEGKFGTYKLIKEIGWGGNGTVFSVEVVSAEVQLIKKEHFVIKILTDRFRSKREREKREKRFEKEIRTVYQIQNEIEGIIPIYDSSYFLEERGDFAWYLMPEASKYCFEKIYSIEEKLKDMRDLGECIAQLHARNLVHRDIKPQNLLVYKNRVCLSDFGLVWNMDRIDEHITDIHDNMGPIAIQPPEMRNIENIDNIDYRKSDVYLFAKTVWIILTGAKEEFHEEYKRSEKRVYLDKKKLRVETAEPLHEMLESATRYWWWERIDINACVQHIDEQLSIITKSAIDIKLSKWKYDEAVKEIHETVLDDVRTYQDRHSVLEVLKRLSGVANLVFEETGNVYDPMFFKGAEILAENLFELDVRSNFYGNRRKIIVEINKISIMKDLSCVMNTNIVTNQPVGLSIFTNLNNALHSMDKHICISGMYIVRFLQIGSSFH